MLIIEMKMPQKCFDCPMHDYARNSSSSLPSVVRPVCNAHHELTPIPNGNERPSWCPIKGELVRCGECNRGLSSEAYGDAKYCMGVFHNLNWFCADGERKDGEG